MPDNRKSGPSSKLDRNAVIAMTRKMAGNKQSKSPPPNKPQPLFNPAKTDFKTLEVFKDMDTQRAAVEFIGLKNPYFTLHEGRAGATTMIDGREMINFSSYDYLELNGHESVAKAAKQAIDQHGTSVSASRPTAGERPVHRKLERQIADLYKTDEALVFVSGHSTNVSTIGDLMGPKDLIIFDALSHNSITVGARLSGAARRRYGHNDLKELAAILGETRNKYDRVLIIVEGLYSMDGDIADLPGLIDIKNRFGAWLMVDDAHGLGVLGGNGRGIFEHFGIDPKEVDIWMGTLSKTLAGCGGYIAANSVLIEILKYHASGFMFSVGMPGPVAAASSRALELMLAQPERVKKLQENGQYFLQAAHQAGLDTGASLGFSVIPIIIGDSVRAVKLCNELLEQGVFTIPVTYPAVPMQEARIRFFITSGHTRDQIDTAISTTKTILAKLVESNFSLMTAIDKMDGDQF